MSSCVGFKYNYLMLFFLYLENTLSLFISDIGAWCVETTSFLLAHEAASRNTQPSTAASQKGPTVSLAPQVCVHKQWPYLKRA